MEGEFKNPPEQPVLSDGDVAEKEIVVDNLQKDKLKFDCTKKEEVLLEGEIVQSNDSPHRKNSINKNELSTDPSTDDENNGDEDNAIQKEEQTDLSSNSQDFKQRAVEALGFEIDDFQSWDRIVKLLHRPTDPTSLALSRILFGFLMLLDIPDERGLGEADIRWGDPDECRFPLFNFLEVPPLHWMCMIYFIMWIGAFGIMLGAFFKISCVLFLLPYWYIFILDKTAWNNHSYLYGVLAVLFLATDSHYTWSFDAWRGKVKMNSDIPLWHYAVMRFQMFILYFYAGLKKTELDWLSGHSMQQLSRHWVFHPWKFFFTPEQIDLWVVHVFGFLLDLTAGFWLYFDYTRSTCFFFLTCFHVMNSQLFYIGMFPFVCLATMHLFCSPDWPKKFLMKFDRLKHFIYVKNENNTECIYKEENNESPACITRRQSWSVILILTHVVLQMFIPYSHFITKGYNNWTNGLYGYSWDMMVHTWDTSLVTVKVVDLKKNETIFIDPDAWTRNSKWQRHADMVVQYGGCVSRNLEKLDKLKNISVYFDVWVSLNKRFHQRMFNPDVDLLKAEWSPFRKTPWLMPLLTEFSHWRPRLYQIEKEVHSWSKAADVLFMADFPGFSVQNYIHEDITNVTVTVIEGKINVEVENEEPKDLLAGRKIKIPSAKFHEVHTVSDSPSAYVYTFSNRTRLIDPNLAVVLEQTTIFDWFSSKINNYLNSIALVSNAFLRILYSVPMVRRVRLEDEE